MDRRGSGCAWIGLVLYDGGSGHDCDMVIGSGTGDDCDDARRCWSEQCERECWQWIFF